MSGKDTADGWSGAAQGSGLAGRPERGPEFDPVSEPELAQALGDFRLSVHAWSEAALSRPRSSVALGVARRNWRLAAGWALCFALTVSGLSGGVYEHHQRQQLALAAAARAAEQQRVAAEERAREEEDLLAKVDSDVSREVPSAMEPLAQLMAEDESK